MGFYLNTTVTFSFLLVKGMWIVISFCWKKWFSDLLLGLLVPMCEDVSTTYAQEWGAAYSLYVSSVILVAVTKLLAQLSTPIWTSTARPWNVYSVGRPEQDQRTLSPGSLPLDHLCHCRVFNHLIVSLHFFSLTVRLRASSYIHWLFLLILKHNSHF